MLSQENIILRVTLDGREYSSTSGGAHAIVLAVQKALCPQEPFHIKGLRKWSTQSGAVIADQRETEAKERWSAETRAGWLFQGRGGQTSRVPNLLSRSSDLSLRPLFCLR